MADVEPLEFHPKYVSVIFFRVLEERKRGTVIHVKIAKETSHWFKRQVMKCCIILNKRVFFRFRWKFKMV